jgi:hypothetical protein
MKMIKIAGSTVAVAAALSFTVSCGRQDNSTGAKPGAADVKAAPEAPAAAGQIELKFDLPKPEFQGTPKPVKLPPGLKLHKDVKRKPLMVPEGTVNISDGKTVTGSDDMPIIGEMEQLTDGEKAASDGEFVEFGPGTQWVQIDLENTSEIAAVVIWHYHAQARVYHDIIVQVSDDQDFLSDVTTIYNNDHDNSSGKGVGKDEAYIDSYKGWVVDGKGAKGRYVRLYSNGSTADEMNHYIEVSVFGKPVQ